jgi:pre-rRNA-processing protein TSR4
MSTVPDSPLDLWPREAAFPQPYPHLYVDAEHETLITDMHHSNKFSNPARDENIVEEDKGIPGGLDKELFESSLDRTFQQFSERLAQNPEQILRYEWKGRPLLYSSTDAVGKNLVETNKKTKLAAGMPRCESCGAERVFEMQLVPGTISALEEDSENLEEGMEWGTIILGVCARNCGETGEVTFREEWCGVQWEERG